MGLFDASSTSTTTDSRQGAGDSSQLLRGNNVKLIQGGTDLSHSKVNTGIANSKITTTVKGVDLSKTKLGKGNTINITEGADTGSLTSLFQAALSTVTDTNAASNAALLSGLTSNLGTGTTPTSPAGGDIGGLIHNALAAAGIGSAGSATPGADSSASTSSGGLASWWNGLSTTMKWLIAGGGALLLGALIVFGKKS